MGIDLGFIWVDKKLKGTRAVEESIPVGWPDLPDEANVVMVINPSTPRPGGLDGTGTFIAFFVDQGFAQRRGHVRDFPLEPVACCLGHLARTKVMTAFTADHQLVGGFQIFDRTGRIDHLIIHDDRAELAYLDAPRVGFERLFEAPRATPDRQARLFFTEKLFDSAEAGWTKWALVEGGALLEKPQQLTDPVDLSSDFRSCWAIVGWP